jgi:N4-(beta-N-acetylglucosaminyl)-L-asparaginase
MGGTSRRDLIKGAMILPLAGRIPAPGAQPSPAARPLAISSANGLRAVEKAYATVAAGGDPVDAVVSGVNIIESDPNDITVGYGGIPNEEGVVQLDASVMDGRTMKAGAVAAIEKIKNPSKVARLVMEQTNRVLIVGPGALQFAKAHGFQEEDLLTERSRKIWLYWKEKLSNNDDWIERGDEEQNDPDIRWYIEKYGASDFRPHGTINCDVVTADGALAGCTTTSGLFFKIPGRVGDSPIIGAGLYVDGEVGACGSTGWGEGNLRSCGSHTVIEFLRQGKSPEEAALKTLERIVAMARDMRDKNGRPDFNLNFYVVTRKGEYAGAAVWSGYYGSTGKFTPSRFAVADASGSRLQESAYLYARPRP